MAPMAILSNGEKIFIGDVFEFSYDNDDFVHYGKAMGFYHMVTHYFLELVANTGIGAVGGGGGGGALSCPPTF